MGLFILQTIIFVVAISLDSFIASFSTSINKIKIPFLSAFILSLITTAFLAAALFLGSSLSHIIPPDITLIIGVTVLFAIGLFKLFDSIIKAYIKKRQGLDKKIKFKFLSLNFMLNIYAAPETSDADDSKVLSLKEASTLAIVLSLDSITAGFGLGATETDMIGFLWIILAAFVVCMLFIYLGALIGYKISKKVKLDLSWLSGLAFIALGFMNIFL